MISLGKIRQFLLNFPLGMFFGAILILLLLWGLDGDFLKQWEKIATNIFSTSVGLIAATLALAGVLSNIQNQIDIKEKERVQKLLAARAVLPLTLSRLYRLCSNGVSTALATMTLRVDQEKARQSLDALIVSSDDLKTLKECIEFADPASAAWLSLIVAHFQIQLSSLEDSLFDPRLMVEDRQIPISVANWILIRHIVGHLFIFSRTGIPAANVLSQLRVPLDMNIPHDREREIGDAISAVGRYFDETGGWSASAFQNRLPR